MSDDTQRTNKSAIAPMLSVRNGAGAIEFYSKLKTVYLDYSA